MLRIARVSDNHRDGRRLDPADPGRVVRTVFDLLGENENDLTFALGWGLAQSSGLTRALLADLFEGTVGDPSQIDLQQSGLDRGYTDIEIRAGDAHLVIEAKRGWVVPTAEQLARYAARFEAPRPLLLALTECSPAFSARRLPTHVGGVPVTHRSWQQMITLVRSQLRSGTLTERHILRDLHQYLRGIMTTQDTASNWTYVVSLNRERPTGSSISFLDVVLDKARYFHPYASGGGWPKVPPNYLAFRWDARVRRIHHVEGYTVVDDLNEVFSEIERGHTIRPHIVYTLGPAIVLNPPLPVGAHLRAARRWVALDLLLTAASLQAAVEATRSRQVIDPDARLPSR